MPRLEDFVNIIAIAPTAENGGSHKPPQDRALKRLAREKGLDKGAGQFFPLYDPTKPSHTNNAMGGSHN